MTCTHYEDQQGLCHNCGIVMDQLLWEQNRVPVKDERILRVSIDVKITSAVTGEWPVKAEMSSVAEFLVRTLTDWRDGRHPFATELLMTGLEPAVCGALDRAEWAAHSEGKPDDYLICGPASKKAVEAVRIRADAESITVEEVKGS